MSDIALSICGFTLAYVLLFVTLSRLTGRAWIAFGVFAASLFLVPRDYKYYVFLAPLLVSFLICRYVETPTVRRLLAVAGAVTLSGLYRPDYGMFTFVAGCAGVVLAGTPHLASAFRRLGLFTAGVVAFASPWLVFLLLQGQLGSYLYDSSISALDHAAGLALPIPHADPGSPFSDPKNLQRYSFLFWYSVPVVAIVILRIRWQKLGGNYRLSALLTVLLGSLCLTQSLHRSDFGHLLQALSVSYITMGFLINEAYALLRAGWPSRFLGLAISGFCVVTLSATIAAGYAKQHERVTLSRAWEYIEQFYWQSPQEFLRATQESYGEQVYARLAAVIRRYTEPDERLVAVPFMTSLYMFSERTFGGGQSHMAPGYFSSEEDQMRLVATLAKQGNPLIVERKGGGFDGQAERKARVFAETFFKYVDRHYRRIHDDEIPVGYLIWVRKEAPGRSSEPYVPGALRKAEANQ